MDFIEGLDVSERGRDIGFSHYYRPGTLESADDLRICVSNVLP